MNRTVRRFVLERLFQLEGHLGDELLPTCPNLKIRFFESLKSN